MQPSERGWLGGGRSWSAAKSPHARRSALSATAVFASFLAFSAVRAPVPGVNEPHYLTKAKHFWDPAWCAGDLFLESADTHRVFYQTIGVLTQWFSLTQTAWIGRVLALGLLAIGWTALVSRLVPGRWTALWAAWAYLATAVFGTLSGEWMVGGVEAKVFAYGFLFFALAMALDRRWIPAGLCGGLAVAFHPVVGLWGAIAALVGSRQRAVGRRSEPVEDGNSADGLLLAWALFVLVASAGVVPALNVVGGTDPQTARAAEYIQFAYRLAHHLDPLRFSPWAYAGYAAIVVSWLVLRRWSVRSPAETFFTRFVLATLAIAAAGFLIGLGPRPVETMPAFALRIRLLKFYPFRLFDVAAPMALAFTLAGAGQTVFSRSKGNAENPESNVPAAGNAAYRLLPAAYGLLLAWALLAPVMAHDPSTRTAAEQADWRDVCRWVREHTEPDDLFLTPRYGSDFKWYAHRPEYVTIKDCPQDAASIVEWNRRLLEVRRWAEENHPHGYSAADLGALRRETGVDWLLTQRLGPFQVQPVYRNGTYAVYRVP